ncbi:MAG: GGDEF domain-containing protein [Actinobacteria bacterium]|nr:GGDEF domain-containing protein [Actinomycetota bacterium]
MKLECRRGCRILLIALLFLMAAGLTYYFGILEFSLWLLFLPGLAISVIYFQIYGSALYIFFTGIYGLVVFYYTMASVDYQNYFEVTTAIYSFLFYLTNLLLISVLFSYRIEKLKKEKEKIKEVVLIDQLTGLKNYGYFVSRLEEERKRSDKEDRELSLVMIDIDHFKEFNDRFGHQRGNEILIKASKIIENNIRSKDIVCRYGGEEFAVILPDTSLEKAFEIAERIRKAFENEYFFGSKAFPRVRKTVSCGVASYPRQAKDEFELIDMADRALYYAKETGRNRTVCYGDEVELKWFKGIIEEI